MAEDKLITPEEKERLQRQHRHTLKQMRLRRNGGAIPFEGTVGDLKELEEKVIKRLKQG